MPGRFYGLGTHPDTWRFRETGRIARIVCLRSSSSRDVVTFRFIDDRAPGRAKDRQVTARRFLQDFERVAVQR